MTTYTVPENALKRPRTRIVCTLGPATASDEKIEGLIRAGMSVARINLSHGTEDEHTDAIERVRRAAVRIGVAVGVLADLPGPKHRLGPAPEEPVTLNVGQRFTLRDGTLPSTLDTGYVHPDGFIRSASAAEQVLIADGAIQLHVTGASADALECEVTVGGPLESHKSVSSPGRASSIGYLTEETSAALKFAAQEAVDFVGISYIRSAADVRLVREFFAAQDSSPQLIAKIELAESMLNLDEIIDAADGVMVARGDLGVELPFAQVPGSQKDIIRRANAVGKAVITATQMLESMINAPSPTRAEVTDVANAVLDGTDAIMLSAETSIGRYPEEATTVMADIAAEAEKSMDGGGIAERRRSRIEGIDGAIADAACLTAERVGARVILAFTESGSTAARVAAFRPSAPIIALAHDPAVGRALSLRWGVVVVSSDRPHSVSEMFRLGSHVALESGLARRGDRAVAVMGVPIGVRGSTNLLRVIVLPEAESPGPGDRDEDG